MRIRFNKVGPERSCFNTHWSLLDKILCSQHAFRYQKRNYAHNTFVLPMLIQWRISPERSGANRRSKAGLYRTPHFKYFCRILPLFYWQTVFLINTYCRSTTFCSQKVTMVCFSLLASCEPSLFEPQWTIEGTIGRKQNRINRQTLPPPHPPLPLHPR